MANDGDIAVEADTLLKYDLPTFGILKEDEMKDSISLR